MGLAHFINSQTASRYLKKPELTGFLDFMYPTVSLQFAGLVNELCCRLGIEKAPFVRSAAFEVTNRCNLKCLMCPHNKGDFREKGGMDIGLFRKTLEANPKLDLVQLNGWGEPFLHPELIDFMAFACENGRRVYLYSNGTLLDEDKMKRIIDVGLTRIVISVDGIEGAYETTRGSSYRELEEKIQALIAMRNAARSPMTVDVSMVGSKDTENEIDAFRSRWQGKADRVQILSHIEHTHKARSARCRELWRGNPQILWNGNVTVCCADWAGELVFGTLGTDGYDLQKLYNCGRMREERRRHVRGELVSLCTRCNEYSSEDITGRFS